ncbi:MAG TPA: hypothetical protein VJ654_06640 [Noviherbaspirillum sp.]|nr:hypothetical protein [Noviherbaspirillum sp.]
MIEQKLQAAMLSEYTRRVGLYQDLAATVASLLGQILNGIQLHSVNYRCKSPDSLSGKLARAEKDYAQLSDVTDLAAVRVTTYFAEDVDRVAAIVEREFLIDHVNSVDKRKLLDADRFGYQSLHYIASVAQQRSNLVEYARFKEMRFEIQVRSILQHAWAEIEHDLGYKSSAGIPKDVRRRFSRLAGLLELADDEFSAIRRALDTYASSIPKEIREHPQNVGIDKISLRALLKSENSAVLSLSKAVARIAHTHLTPTSDELLEASVGHLSFLQISTIAEIEKVAASYIDKVEIFANAFFLERRPSTLHEGVGILYLAYMMLGERGDRTQIKDFLARFRLPSEISENMASRILKASNAINSSR